MYTYYSFYGVTYLFRSVALLALNRSHDFHQTRDELLLSGDGAAKEWLARLR